ncbi:MAG: V-type ATP synthase subunit A, partial [Bacilli bacterium]|nr:V-type ATP synthase subunit A [Bacilli bacterium]
MNNKTTGKVVSIISNLVLVHVNGPVFQNEICYIDLNEERLMAEVIKVINEIAYVQVFENTRGLKPGCKVEFEGHMLEVALGPGLLSKNFDGLQNDLDKMEGVFLKRGVYTHALEENKKWAFSPLAKVGDKVIAGDWIGNVKENWLDHKIMIPFKLEGEFTIEKIAESGEFTILDTIAEIKDKNGKVEKVTMMQHWPVKLAIKSYKNKPRPYRQLETGVRVIDTMNPILEGGTGFIPGPFGTGKTVLQHALAKYADAEIIIMAACGERANEVVEIFSEFPHLEDPRTGRSLYERTTIIANTSNMPVAAREASVYTAMTIGEYYRAMGMKVFLLADSTSR